MFLFQYSKVPRLPHRKPKTIEQDIAGANENPTTVVSNEGTPSQAPTLQSINLDLNSVPTAQAVSYVS